MYQIFRRNWWKKENNRLVPDFYADEIEICEVHTEKEAREVCADYNEGNDAGELSHKAEYREI